MLTAGGRRPLPDGNSLTPRGVTYRRKGCARIMAVVVCLLTALIAAGCRQRVERKAGEVVFLIESNPANLDPRYAVDGQSQRIAALLFSGLVKRDDEMNVHGDLAETWETPDALTYVFHLRKGVKFHDGREVTSKDVKATIEFMMNAANRSPKRGAVSG